jgi:hypothetical protein
MKRAIKTTDPYMRHVRDFLPKAGLSSLDVSRRTPGPELVRTRELVGEVQERYLYFPRNSEELLCRGAACGTIKGIVSHVCQRSEKFVGFCVDNVDMGGVHIWARGTVVLKIPGAKPYDRVYCTGPDSFNVSREGVTIGYVVRVFPEDGRCSVIFPFEG